MSRQLFMAILGSSMVFCTATATARMPVERAERPMTSPAESASRKPFSPQPCLPSKAGHNYQVGPGKGQLSDLAQVPWENLAAGDTVRIFYRSTPYAGKFAINAHGTASAPVRVCGVKGPNGERPIIDGADAVSRSTMSYGRASASTINQTRGIVMIVSSLADALGNPSYIQIDGLKFQHAQPAYGYTDTTGLTQPYTDFGGCIWIEQGQHIAIADNEITDCSQAIFSRSSDWQANYITHDIRIAGNTFSNNGIVGDEQMHTTYLQSVGVTYEFNNYGPLRTGALGNSIKDRSVGSVVRYNRIEAGSYGVDLVEEQDYDSIALPDPAYRTAYVYGNQFVLPATTILIHYGGDHTGSEANYRKGTLYFYNNTAYYTGTNPGNADAAYLFRVSTTQETAQVWNNVFAFAPTIQYPALRITQDVAAGYTAGGIVNLGVNWINAGWGDGDPWHPVPGQLNGGAHLITGATLPIDILSLAPLANGQAMDNAQPLPAQVAEYPVDYQLDTLTDSPVERTTQANLGAVEN
jgi:hypothetical protein